MHVFRKNIKGNALQILPVERVRRARSRDTKRKVKEKKKNTK
jgi:hypothetical protein